MRVVVSSFGETLNQQIRRYAEYRVFSTLSTLDDVLGARVNLHAAGDTVQCDVEVTLTSSSVAAHTSSAHAAAAIDQAADRLAALILAS